MRRKGYRTLEEFCHERGPKGAGQLDDPQQLGVEDEGARPLRFGGRAQEQACAIDRLSEGGLGAQSNAATHVEDEENAP